MKAVYAWMLLAVVMTAICVWQQWRAPAGNPYYQAHLEAAAYRSLPECGQPDQPNTPKPCADETVLKVLEMADETAMLSQNLIVQLGQDPGASLKARRAAVVWAEHSAQALKHLTNHLKESP